MEAVNLPCFFILGGMLKPSSGIVSINNSDIYDLSSQKRAQLRADTIGFVFQAYHLLPYLNVLENIKLSNKLLGVSISNSDVIQLATELGIKDRLYHKPSMLSAGEKQRVALARALITKPALILADEPTGNLDSENTIAVMKHLKSYQEMGGTVIMVTHGHLADSYATRTITLKKGELITNSN